MDRLSNRPIITVLVLALLCGYLFFFQLGKFALTDPDETFYAETAKEMIARGEWVTPYLYGQPQFEKPILFYWLVEASFKVFGVNEFGARFPSALLGMIGVIAMFLFARALFSPRAGFLSALILATNIEYIVLSRACVTDMALFVFMELAVLFFLCGYFKEKTHFYLLSAVSIALAVLTKGPVYLILFASAAAVFLFFMKDLRALKKMPLWRSCAVFLVITAPWYLAIYHIHGKAFIDGFFGFHNVNRFLVSEHKIGSQFYYNIPIVFGGFFPWSIFIPVGFWHMFRKIREPHTIRFAQVRDGRGLIFIAAYFIVVFGFFSISSTKLPTYIFPCFMSLAIIAGKLLDDFLSRETSMPITKGVKISYYILAVVMLFGWVGGAIYARLDLPSILAGAVISGLCLAFGMLVSMASFAKNRFMLAFTFVAFSVALFLIPLNALIMPEVERYETSKEVSSKLSAVMAPGDDLGAESNYVPGLAFYTGTFPVELDKHQAQISFLNSKNRIWAVMKEKNHRHLYDPEITKAYVKPSYVVFRAGKRAMITNEIPADGKFLIRRGAPA